MGQTLSEPVVEKHSAKGASSRFAYAFSEMQGWRITMEDAHATILSLPPAPQDSALDAKAPIETEPSPDSKVHPAFFAVYDGHGGSTVAKYTGATLHNRLAKLPSYASGDYEDAMRRAFLSTDEDLRADPEYMNDPSGCTAVAVLVTDDNRIICANAGDSRALISVGGKEEPLSHDHKPVNKEEHDRITAAGGFVEFGRVNGNLALSRAVGDFEFKQNYSLDAEHQVVTVNPDIIVHTSTGEEEFIVVACDGIWDCLSSQQVVDFTRRAIANGDSLTRIAENMMEKCLAPDSELGGVGCDNMTVVVIAVLNGKTVEEWQAWVKNRVENNVGYTTPESVPDCFKTPPKYDRAPSSTASNAVHTAGNAAMSGVSSLSDIVDMASGKISAGGMSLQDILKASGITLSSAGDGEGEYEDSDTDDSMNGEEGAKKAIAETTSIPSDPSKSGSIELISSSSDDQSSPATPATTSSTTSSTNPPTTESPASTSERSTPQASGSAALSSVGSPLVPSHPELSSNNNNAK